MARKKDAGSSDPDRPAPGGLLSFLETALFSDDWSRLGLTLDDLADLQALILADPTRHPVVRGTGGLRKVRFAGRRSDRGKSGSYRICYALFLGHGLVYLIAAFGKYEQTDLTPNQRKTIAELIRLAKASLEKGGLP